MYEAKTDGPDVATQSERQTSAGIPCQQASTHHELHPMHWHDGVVLHACEGLLLTDSIRTSVIITACGKSPPDDAVAYRSETDPPVDCPLCLWHLARVW